MNRKVLDACEVYLNNRFRSNKVVDVTWKKTGEKVSFYKNQNDYSSFVSDYSKKFTGDLEVVISQMSDYIDSMNTVSGAGKEYYNITRSIFYLQMKDDWSILDTANDRIWGSRAKVLEDKIKKNGGKVEDYKFDINKELDKKRG